MAAFILAIFTKRTHALGCLITNIVSIAVNYLVKHQVNEGLEVVYYSGKKEVLILVGYFMAMVLFSLYLPQWLT